MQPHGFWPNFYSGVCAYRQKRLEDAVNAFRVCIALAPESAACYYNRALAEAALARNDRALTDYTLRLAVGPRPRRRCPQPRPLAPGPKALCRRPHRSAPGARCRQRSRPGVLQSVPWSAWNSMTAPPPSPTCSAP